MKCKGRRRMSVWRYLALGYLLLILLGAFLLSLPIASASGKWTSFVDALFTSTSATCVTGLTPVVTGVHWNVFGKIVILILVQTGGLGFTTFATLILMAIKGGGLDLYTRTVMSQSMGGSGVHNVRKLVRRIFVGTLVIELVGALLLMIRFVPEYGGLGVWHGVYHSITAFCNAGFDIVGLSGQSLVDYATDPLVSIVISLLIIIGGLGFFVWGDIFDCKGNPGKFTFYTRLALTMTLILVVAGTALFLLFEWNNPCYEGYSFGDKLLCSFFNSVTARTAGFFTTPPETLSNSGSMLMIILMFIGACSGSTGGGIKASTFAVIMVGMVSFMRGKRDVTIGKRRIDDALVGQALAIFAAYLTIVMVAVLAINAIEPDANAPFAAVMFEVVSAIGTVGLSMALTPTLGIASKLILTLLMYLGRVGVLTFALALKRSKKSEAAVRRPIDNVFIG